MLDQAIKYFEGLGWKVVGDPTQKSINANGADVVFTQGEKALAVELKDVNGNVTLGTLGKSASGDYGGSISRVVRSAERLATSSNSQLQLESQIIQDASDAGKLENALFTSGKGVSKGAQGQFTGVYVRTPGDDVTAMKSLPASGGILNAVKENIFNYYVGARMIAEGAKDTAITLGTSALDTPVFIVPSPNLFLDPKYNLCSPLCLPQSHEPILD